MRLPQRWSFGKSGASVKGPTKAVAEKIGWHSWDPHPWKHPWLSKENLKAAKDFSRRFLELERGRFGKEGDRDRRYAFVGNMANNLFVRAMPLRRAGVDVDMVLHPHDNFVMNSPAWEVSDCVVEDGTTEIDALKSRGFPIADVPGVYQYESINDWQVELLARPRDYMRAEDAARYELVSLPAENARCSSRLRRVMDDAVALFGLLVQSALCRVSVRRRYLVRSFQGRFARRRDAKGLFWRPNSSRLQSVDLRARAAVRIVAFGLSADDFG